MHVCVATPDILGPIRNGGVGTAFFGLCQALKAAGHRVTIFYTSTYYEEGDRHYWAKDYEERHDIEFVALEDAQPDSVRTQSLGGAEEYILRSYKVYEYFKKRRDFDVIHFPDYLGLAYYTIMARTTGVDFVDTPIIVTMHGPIAWSRSYGYSTLKSLEPVVSGVLEKFVVENADMVVSPSRFLLNWVENSGWRLPERTVHAYNVIPRGFESGDEVLVVAEQPATKQSADGVRELVFFGRIEQRKGIYLFIDAINDLLDRSPELLEKVRITFLGKFNTSSISRQTFGLRLKNWPMPWKCIDDWDSGKALNYLAQPGRIAVIPSLMDNSPCTIVECLERGIPFIATSVGGIPELVHEKKLLPEPNAHDFAGALERILQSDQVPTFTPTYAQAAAAEKLVAYHEEITGLAVRDVELPKISVCLLHRNRPGYLKQAMNGLRSQSYRPFEVIIVDNGSAKPDAVSYLSELETSNDLPFPLKVVWMKYNAFPGPARNAAARAASGDVLKFHDDDNISKESELETFARAIANGFDVATCALDFFIGSPNGRNRIEKKPLVFLGDGGCLNLLYNMAGDSNLAIKKSVFDSLGGFSDLGFLYHAEDWLLLAKAQAAGCRICTIPEPIIWYRDENDRYLTNWRKQDVDGARFRVAQVFAEGSPTRGVPLINFCAGFYHEHSSKKNTAKPPVAPVADSKSQVRASAAPKAAPRKAVCESDNVEQNVGANALDAYGDMIDRYWIAACLAKPRRSFGGWFKRNKAKNIDPQKADWGDLRTAVKGLTIPVPDSFDEKKYLNKNPDVATAVAAGGFPNGYTHYLLHGRAEGRGRTTK